MAALAERAIEHPDIDGRRDRSGERRADMLDERNQREVEREVHADRDGGEAHRGARVLAGEEAWSENLDQHIRGQADGEGRKRPGRAHRILGSELAMLEEAAYDRLGRDDEGDGRGEREEQRQLDAAILRFHRFRLAPGAEQARDGGEQDRAEPDADHPERQLVQPIGIIDVRDRALGEQGAGERGRDDQIDLHRPRAGGRGEDELHQAANLGIEPRPAGTERDAGGAAGDPQPEQLEQSADRHCDRLCPRSLLRGAVEEQQSRDHCDVEQDRRGGVDPEFVERIEDSAEQRGEADQHQIGDGDPRQFDCEGELLVRRMLLREAPGQAPGERPGGGEHHRGHHGEEEEQHRERLLGKSQRGGQLAIVLANLAVEHRDEGGSERSFGEEGAEHVGQAEGDEERVRREARADESRLERIADERQHAAGQGEPADRAEAAGELHGRPRWRGAGMVRVTPPPRRQALPAISPCATSPAWARCCR